MPVEIFCCYTRKDRSLLHRLISHLAPLQRQELITIWADTDIGAGVEWERELEKHLNTSQIILLLISSDFMNSDYCYSTEMKRAMERHEQGEARVIPIFLRPTDWKGAPFVKLQALPTDAKPVTDPYWVTQDRAFIKIEVFKNYKRRLERMEVTLDLGGSNEITEYFAEAQNKLLQEIISTFRTIHLHPEPQNLDIRSPEEVLLNLREAHLHLKLAFDELHPQFVALMLRTRKSEGFYRKLGTCREYLEKALNNW